MRAAVERRFGTTDRARIAEIVFAESDELAWLEELLHPLVRRECAAWLEGLGTSVEVGVVEIPLLYETGAEVAFDAVVVVTAREELRASRAGARVAQRSGRLIPDEEKARRADFAYVNDGSLEDLDAFVRSVLERLNDLT